MPAPLTFVYAWTALYLLLLYSRLQTGDVGLHRLHLCLGALWCALFFCCGWVCGSLVVNVLCLVVAVRLAQRNRPFLWPLVLWCAVAVVLNVDHAGAPARRVGTVPPTCACAPGGCNNRRAECGQKKTDGRRRCRTTVGRNVCRRTALSIDRRSPGAERCRRRADMRGCIYAVRPVSTRTRASPWRR